MATIKIILYKNKTYKDGSHPIIIQVIHDREKKVIWLNHRAKTDQWDEESSLPNRKYPNASRLSILIREKINEAEKAVLEFENDKKLYTAQDVINKIAKDRPTDTIFTFAEKVINQLETSNKIGNSKVYQSMLNVFKAYRNEKDLNFKNLDFKKLDEFQNYLISKGDKINTISIHMRTLRALYTKAMKYGLVKSDHYPFKEFKIKTAETQKRAISKPDIDKIRDLDLSGRPELIFARDVFMFSFYMRGMSLIDIAMLKVKDINENRITYSRRKTGQKFSIKIPVPAMKIIKRYNNLDNQEDYLLPIIYDFKNEYLVYRNALRLINKKLKKIATLVQLEITLTTYVARHSWATIAKKAGISTAIISEGLGHDSEETTQIYLDSFENKVLDDANELIIA
jgi:site-specific recombinase XerD